METPLYFSRSHANLPILKTTKETMESHDCLRLGGTWDLKKNITSINFLILNSNCFFRAKNYICIFTKHKGLWTIGAITEYPD